MNLTKSFAALALALRGLSDLVTEAERFQGLGEAEATDHQDSPYQW